MQQGQHIWFNFTRNGEKRLSNLFVKNGEDPRKVGRIYAQQLERGENIMQRRMNTHHKVVWQFISFEDPNKED